MKTKVLLRETNEKVSVEIKDDLKPVINEYLREQWQGIISLVADVLNVPAGLIMEISDTHMNVFLKSTNKDNPYPSDGKDTLLHGLYCETVIGTDKPLHVDNSLHYDKWKDNPDVSLNMISYYGLPLKWSDGKFFGTICALDNKTNAFDKKYRLLMMKFRDIIEQDLKLYEQNKLLEIQTDYDALTKIFNRRKFDQDLQIRFENYSRYGTSFSLVLMDIDAFKHINDVYGHVSGDKVLEQFGKIIGNRIRKTDAFYRYGGDEFALLTSSKSEEEILELMLILQSVVEDDPLLSKYFINFSYGQYIVDELVNKPEDIILLADKKLYKNKQKK